MDLGPAVCIGIPLARKPVIAVFCARVLEIKLSTIKIRDAENGSILVIH